VTGVVWAQPGHRSRLIYRMLVHHSGRRSEKGGFREDDFAALLDAAHQQDALTCESLTARRRWLTVFRRLSPSACGRFDLA
jgi:hypothetical protein